MIHRGQSELIELESPLRYSWYRHLTRGHSLSQYSEYFFELPSDFSIGYFSALCFIFSLIILIGSSSNFEHKFRQYTITSAIHAVALDAGGTELVMLKSDLLEASNLWHHLIN
jgi:hypothetical protein